MPDDSAWKPLLDELTRRDAAARAMGGAQKLARQREGGRLDAHARVAALLDAGSFREIGALVGARDGALRAAARLFAVQARLHVPKLQVTLRKAYGFASSNFAMNPFDAQTVTLGLPGASLAAMPARGASDASGADADALGAAERSGPWSAADALGYDAVIDPRALRNALAAQRSARGRRSAAPEAAARIGIRP